MSGNKILLLIFFLGFISVAKGQGNKKLPHSKVKNPKDTGWYDVKLYKDNTKGDTGTWDYIHPHDMSTPIGLPHKYQSRKDSTDSLLRLFPLTLKEKYTISVFMPFFLDSANRENNQKTAVSVSREFYKGFLLAADSLQKCGMNLDIHTFDSEKPWNFKSLEDTITRNGTDLIIGPLLEGRIKWMDSVSRKNKINYVSPLQTSDFPVSNPYNIQSVPSAETEGKTAAALVKKNYSSYKLFVIKEKNIDGNAMVETFISQFNEDSINILNCNGHGSRALPENLPLADSNIFLIPSKNEGFVSAVMSKLRVDSSKIVVIAPLQWQFFKTFEGELWEKFQLHVLSPYFIDYNDPAVTGLVKKYRVKYKEEPSTWSFFGFDELVYYARMMNSYGKYFQPGLLYSNVRLIHTFYRMRPVTGGTGWQNEYINLLKFEDYSLRRIAH